MKKILSKLVMISIGVLLLLNLYQIYNNKHEIKADGSDYVIDDREIFVRRMTGHRNGRTLNIKLFNHDPETISSCKIIIRDYYTYDVIDTLEVNDFSSMSYDPSYYSETFSKTFATYDPNQYYSVYFSVDSPYINDVYEMEGDIYCVNLQKIQLTKEWNDNNNAAGKRPDAETFKSVLRFYNDSDEVNPDKIKTISENGNKYVYNIYGGINIRSKIKVEESPDPVGYNLAESTGTTGWNYGGSDNTSEAQLKNDYIKYLDIKLKKVDYDDNSELLPGVVFELYNVSGKQIFLEGQTTSEDAIADNGLIATLTTDGNGEVSFEGLPDFGTYRIVEVANPDGRYGVPKWEKTFNGKDIDVTSSDGRKFLDLGLVENEKKGFGGLKVIKVDSEDDTKLLSGAIFRLYNNSGRSITLNDADATVVEDQGLIKEFTTVDGIYEIDKILPSDGKYKLVEVQAPYHYEMISEETAVDIHNDTVEEVKIANKSVDFVKLRIKKSDYNGRSVAGIKFELINNSGMTIVTEDGEVHEDGKLITTIIIDETGDGEYDGLPKNGKYILREVLQPGFQKMEDRDFVPVDMRPSSSATADTNAVYTFNIWNRSYGYGGFTIYKVDRDSTDIKLPGAVFKLKNDSSYQIMDKNGNIYQPAQIIYDNLVTDEEGKIFIDNILPEKTINGNTARYVLIEVSAPAKYTYDRAQTNISVSVNTNRQITVYNYRNDCGSLRFGKEYAKILSNPDSGKKFNFTVYLNDSEGNPINDSFYYSINEQVYKQLYNDTEYDYDKIEFVEGVAKVQLGYHEFIRIYGLPVGSKYKIEEENSDDYYIVNIKRNPTEGVISYSSDSIDYNNQTLFVNNDNNLKLQFETTKVLEGHDLEKDMFSFELLNGADEVIATVKNDADGKVVFNNIDFDLSNVRLGTLYYKDATDEQRQKIRTWYTEDAVGIYHFNTYDVPDNAYQESYTTKTKKYYKDFTEEEKINGWKGDYVSPSAQNYNYNFGGRDVWITDLNYGKQPYYNYDFVYTYDGEFNYKIREIDDKVTGIEYDDKVVNVKVKISGVLGDEPTIEYIYDEDNQFVNKYEEKEIEIYISKVDTKGLFLKGAQIQILNSKKEVIYSFTSGEEHELIKLKPGKYTFREAKAPNGYTKIADIQFEVTLDGKLLIKNNSNVTVEGNEMFVKNKRTYEPPKTGICR